MELINIPQNAVYACLTSELPNVIKGLGVKSAYEYVNKMYQDPEFSDGIIKPTQRTTIVIVERFMDFLRKMDNEKF